MNIGQITRLPGTRIPRQILTGQPPLDNFLRELDQQLLGSARVRLLTLAEIRDHLVEKVDHLVESGMAEDEALQQAIRSSDSPAELAKPQRAALSNRFLKFGFFLGIGYGLTMGLFFGAIGVAQYGWSFGATTGAGMTIFGGPAFGFFMGWWAAFIQPERELPSASSTGGADTAIMFRVGAGKWTTRLGNLIGVMFVLGAIFFLSRATAEFFHIPFPEIRGFSMKIPWWAELFMGAVYLVNIYMLRLCSREYRVNQAGIRVHGFFQSSKFFPWANLKRVGLLRDIYWWVPFDWKKVRYAEFENGNHKTARLLVFSAMHNADRLFLLMEQKTRSYHQESDPAASRPDRQIGGNPIHLAEEAE